MNAVQDLVYRIGATNENLKSTVRDSQQSIRGLMSTVERSSQTLAQWGRRAARTGSVLTGITVAITKTSIDAASTFEKQMRRVQAVSQSTVSEYRKMSAAAIDMSTKTEHSAMAVAEGMNFMAMAGFNASQIIEAMPSVLQLATAGVMDLGTAADITTNILTGYGLELSELGRANDVLVSAMTGANVDLQMLGESFKFVGPLARSAGVAFEEAAAIIAMFGNAGIQGSMAGTALRSAITRLLNPSKQAQEVLARLGVTAKDASTNQLLPMANILRQLEEAGASASDMMILFGQRAGPALSGLIGQGIDNLDKYIERLRDSEGLAAKIEAQLLNTTEGQRAVFRNTASAIRQTFANDLLPYYRTFLFYLQGVADRLRKLEPEQRIQIIRLGAMAAGIVGLVTVLGFLALGVSGVVNAFLAFGGAIAFMMSVKGLAIAAIISAVGLLKKAWDSDFGGIKTTTEEVWKVVKPALEGFWEILQRSWAWAIDIAKDITDWIFNTTWAEKWADIKGWLDTVWKWTITIGASIKEWIFDTTWAEKWKDIKGWLDTTWKWTVNLLGDAWEWLEKHAPWLTTTLETLWGYLEKAWEWTISTAGDAWAWFKDTELGQWLDDLKAKITNSKAWKWTIDVALPAIVEGGEVVLKAVIEASGKMYDAIKKGLDTGDWSDFWNVASDVWSTGVVIAITLSSVVNGIQAVLSAITSGLGLVTATGASLGLPGLIGALSIGIQLMEAQAEGSYKDFAKNVIAAGLIAAFLYPVLGPGGTLVGFNLTLNLKIGKDAYDGFAILFDWISYNLKKLFTGQWRQFMTFDDFIKSRAKEKTAILIEGYYEENLQYAIAETKKHDKELWDEYAGKNAQTWDVDENDIRKAVGLPEVDRVLEPVMPFVKDLAEMYPRYGVSLRGLVEQLISPELPINDAAAGKAIEETADDVERLTGELSKLEKQALIVAETLKQGGTMEQALALLGIAYWETRGYGGYTHTDPTTGEVIRGGAGEYGIGQVMPSTGEDVWTRLWKQPAETYDEEMLKDLDTNIAMMVSYFLDRYRVADGDLRRAIEGYNRGTAIDGMQAYTVGVVKWMEGPEGQSLANILYGGMENALEAMVQAGYDIDGDVRKMAAFLAQSMADYLVGQSPPPKGPLANIKLGMKNTMDAGIEGAEEGLLDGIGRLLSAAQKIGEVAQAWGKDFVHYFTEGVEKEAFAQRDRMAQIAAFTLQPFTFDDPENDLWAFTSGADMLKWFGKGMESAARGVVELVKALIDALFNAIRTKIAERYPELLEFFEELRNEVDEAIKTVEELLDLGADGEDEGGQKFKTLRVETEMWIKTLTDGLASAIAYGRSLTDVFDNFLRMIAQSALQEIFNWGVGKVLASIGLEFASAVPTFHYGGLVMHSGGMIDGLRPDEVPLIAQRGERILSRKQNDKFEQMLEDSEFEGAGSNVNLNIYAMDAKSFVDMVRRNPEAITSVLVDDFQSNGIMRRLVMG